MTVRRATHVAITRHLGENGGRRDRSTGRVAPDDCALLVADVPQTKPVDQADRVLARDAFERRSQRLEVRPVQAACVDSADASDHDRRLRGRAQHERVQLLTAGLGVLLGVVQTSQRAALGEGQLLEIEEDRCGDKRAGERPATSLVSPGNEAPIERPVEREKTSAGASGTLLRGCRSGRAASR
jgi:hypothetical protein